MKKLYFLNEEEKNRILNLHESSTKRQYLSEQGNSKEFTPAATACIKQFGEPKPAKTPGFVQVVTDKATVFFSTDYEVRYRPTGGEIVNGQWSCKGNVFNVNLTDGSTWSKAQGGWKTSANKAAEDKTKKTQQYKQQIITKTSDTTKEIQSLLGLDKTGNMDSGLLQKINDKLNGKPQEAPKSDANAQPRPKVEPVQQLTQAGVNTQQITTLNPEQLTAGLQQMQQKVAASTAGLKR